jgi:hypothetical protein
MVMDGIVRGVEKGTGKPVVDGIVRGIEKPKKLELVPETMSVKPSATKLSADTFGSGLTPQGVGNMVGGGKKKMK